MACCKKIYVLPKFPLTVNIFTGGGMAPMWGGLRITTVGQLQFGDRSAGGMMFAGPGPGLLKAMYLLLPPLTDLKHVKMAGVLASDVIEVPAGTTRWYDLLDFDDEWKGFATAYRVALLTAKVPWPNPAP